MLSLRAAAELLGGELEIEEAPLALNPRPMGPLAFFLNDLRFLCRCWKLMRLPMAGDPKPPVGKALDTWGVVTKPSSMSSSMMSSSEEELESDPIAWALPKEWLRFIFS